MPIWIRYIDPPVRSLEGLRVGNVHVEWARDLIDKPLVAQSETSVTYRVCNLDDAEGVLEVLTAAFGRWPRFDVPVELTEHLRWQLSWPPVGAKSHFVAEVDGRIACVALACARAGRMHGEPISVWMGTDSATLPAFQGHGLYSKLRTFRREATLQDHDLMMSIDLHPAIKHGHEQDNRGVRLSNDLRVYLKILDPGKLSRMAVDGEGIKSNPFLRRLAFRGLKLAGSMASSRTAHQDRSFSVHEIAAFDERIDALWEEASPQFDFILERTREFLNWRYRDNRGGESCVLVCEAQDGQILGYVVLKAWGGRGHILDLLALPGRSDVVSALIETAEAVLKGSGMAAIDCWMIRSHPYSAQLSRHGFMDSRRKTNLFCAPMRMTREDLKFLDDPATTIHLMDGDLI